MSSNMPTALADGRYQLGQLIGRGGMAEVHVALDTRLGRTVAIKIMRADLANDDIFLARFRREAHAVAQMNNPNIVNIYDSGEETVTADNGDVEHLPYIVMEYVKGQTLRDIIKVNGALSQRDCEQVMLGVLNALDYSHRMGIIHRDIKPGNIMISEQGVVKVMDFGIARALDDSAATMTQSQGVVGTAQYLSPEQARGETVDMRSDLYSAGCVLYEMLTGRPPFTGDSAVAIAYQHVSEVATPPSSVVPGLPKMWDSICAKAMAKDRQNRYATASEFKNDVLTYMNGGVPVAAAFNPLTDLSNMKARRDAERDLPTAALGQPQQPTQAFNPVTGQFEQISPTNGTNAANVKSRAEQRAAAAKAKKRKRIIIGVVVASIAVIAIVVGVAFAMNGSHTSTEELVAIPECTASTSKDGMDAKLKAAGLTMVEKRDTDSTEPEGTCTRMSPKAGTKVAKGSKVQVWFSAGPQSISIPDVSKRTQDEARNILKDAGFEVNSVVKTEDSDSVAKDLVTRTDPANGTTWWARQRMPCCNSTTTNSTSPWNPRIPIRCLPGRLPAWSPAPVPPSNRAAPSPFGYPPAKSRPPCRPLPPAPTTRLQNSRWRQPGSLYRSADQATTTQWWSAPIRLAVRRSMKARLSPSRPRLGSVAIPTTAVVATPTTGNSPSRDQ